jgi:hypothetical protein
MPFVTAKDKTEIFYKDWGNPSGPVVVFSHGWPLNSDSTSFKVFIWVILREATSAKATKLLSILRLGKPNVLPGQPRLSLHCPRPSRSWSLQSALGWQQHGHLRGRVSRILGEIFSYFAVS